MAFQIGLGSRDDLEFRLSVEMDVIGPGSNFYFLFRLSGPAVWAFRFCKIGFRPGINIFQFGQKKKYDVGCDRVGDTAQLLTFLA